MTKGSATDELLSRLKPFIDSALETGGDVLGEVGTELTSKASGGITSLGLRALGAVHRAVRNRLGHARAKKKLDSDLQTATNDAAREAAYRRFLDADPELRKSLASLLERRDYLQALKDFCDDLPISDLVPGRHRLSDVFVPPKLNAVSPTSDPQSRVALAVHDRLFSGSNHIILGDTGSGKSSLARWMARTLATELLSDENALALDHLRLPVYVSAAELKRTNWSTALGEAIDGQLGLRGLSKLSEGFFDPHAANGHRLWTVLIDGFDEIDNQAARQSVFQIIADISRREPEAFRFLLFARPGTISIPFHGFEFWQIADLGDPRSLISKYLDSEPIRHQLSSLLTQPDYREIARNPFFVAMSAALIDQARNLPATPFALVEAFVDYGISKAPAEKRDAIYELLKQIAGHSGIDASTLLKLNRAACSNLSEATAAIRIQQDVDMALRATGLVKPTQGGGYRFLHRLIDRHLLAEVLAESDAPDSSVWTRFDPRSLGWAAVEQLCVRWAEQGKDAGTAIEALADFGADGTEMMLRLAIQLPDIPDGIFSRPFAALFAELECGELTTVHDELLPRLARVRRNVRHKLYRIVARSSYSVDMVPAARALAEVGEFETIRDRLVEAVNDHEGDPYDQSEIASVLLENGLRDEALSTFVRISESAVDDWMRLDAACRYHRAEHSEASRSRLRQILQYDYVDGHSRITPWLMEQVLDFGETDLALPLLREAAEAPKLGYSEQYFLEFEERRQAAETLARYDLSEGLSALEKLLIVPGISLRQQADILADIHKFEPQGNAPDRLERLVRATPMQTDWRVAEVLIRMGRDETAWNATKQLVQNQFKSRHFDYGVKQVLERVALVAPHHEIDALIDEGLAQRPIPALAWSLALIGKGFESRTKLEAMLEAPCRETGIEAAQLLSKVGARAIGTGWLTRLTRDRNAAPAIRMKAARALDRIAEANIVMSAYRNLIRDTNLDISLRCNAATLHAEISDAHNDVIVDILKVIIRGHGSINDKLTALQTAREIDPYEDFIWDYQAEFLDVLEKNEISPRELPLICSLAKDLEIKLATIPKIKSLLLCKNVAAVLRIDAFSNLANSSGERRFARTVLADFAINSANTWRIRKEAVDALRPDLPVRVSKAIDEWINDALVPPKWRLAIATGGWPISRNLKDAAWTEMIAHDRSISVEVRLQAFEIARRINRDAGHPDFSGIADLTISEHILISETAQSVGRDSLAREHFSNALKIVPKTVYELVCLFNLSVSLANDAAKSALQSEISQLALPVIRHTEDIASVLDAITIMGQVDPDRALSNLTNLLFSDGIDAGEITAVIDRMATFIGEDEALRIAQPVLDKFVGDSISGQDVYSHVPTALRPLYLRGWIKTVEPLFEFAQDSERRFSERVGAVVLAWQTDEGYATRSRQVLNSLVENAPKDARDALNAASELIYEGFRGDALRLVNQISQRETHSPIDIFRLARLLSELGHRATADEYLKTIELESIAKVHLSKEDKAHLNEIFGVTRVEAMQRTRFDSPDQIIDKLQSARNLVDDDGDITSFQTILSLATDVACDDNDRLEAIDALNELGFRELSRSLFETLDLESIEPIWVAEQCSRFGMKNRALVFFRRSIGKTHADNVHLILHGLADLGAVEDIYGIETTA